MKIVDSGHKYRVITFDGDTNNSIIQFVKRKGDRYPGNSNAYPGTITQELIRIIIDRLYYVNNQESAWENKIIIWLMRISLYLLEVRASKKHNKNVLKLNLINIEQQEFCVKCGHLNCFGECDRKINQFKKNIKL